MHRFYCEEPLVIGSSVSLSKEEDHHLRKVMRVREGEEVELVNGKGQLANAVVGDLLEVTKVTEEPPPKFDRILIQALTEPKLLELIVEKGVELGVTHFWLFPAAKSRIHSLSPSKIDRLEKIIRSALKQSKRLYAPEFTLFAKLSEIDPCPSSLYVACPRATSPIPQQIESDRAMIIGPESGFTPEEMDYFTQDRKAKPITLSDQVLRAETASIIGSFLLGSIQ